ncbi:MAG: peroxiredoxin [Hyphomicrobiales bacterium]|nr:peroxiredoxin [Hyphomicrobiales bacterium]
MKRPALALAFALALWSPGPLLAMLAPGARAPDFTIQAALGGKDMSFALAKALKKGPVVLYFYPKSFTSVCTEEAHLFAEATPEFEAMQASVIGVSSDGIETQRKFSSLECRDKFPVGADPDFSVIKAYDAAMGAPSVGLAIAKRISYVIAPDGAVISALADSGAENHIKNALAAVKAWRSAHPQ